MDVDQWRGEEAAPKLSLDYAYLRSSFEGYRAGSEDKEH
jgi:hypothetical protein